ncbi:MAG TPA: DUF4340 domain-containing protein [Planctomycetota bacterium]|nr:DUF4340 domain-containing protein [Planctomycetota bacterium]
MTQSRRVLVVFGVLVVVVGVAAVQHLGGDAGGGPHRRGETRRDVKPLPKIDPAAVHAVELSDSKSSVRLERAGPEEWKLPQAAGAPAQKRFTDDLVRALVGFGDARRVAYATTDKETFGLSPDKMGRLKLFDAKGATLLDLWVGDEDRAGQVADSGTFVREEGSSTVYSHPRRLKMHVSKTHPWQWLDKQLFPGDAKAKNETIAKVDRVELEFADLQPPAVVPSETQPAERPADPADAPRYRVVLEASEQEVPVAATNVGPAPSGVPATRPATEKKKVWRMVEPAGEIPEVFDQAAEGVVRALLFGSMQDVAGGDPTVAAYGFDRPSLEASIRFSDGTTKRLTVGAPAKPSTAPGQAAVPVRYARVDGSDRVFLFSDYALAAFRKKPSEFKKPELPAPIDATPPPIAIPEDAGGESRPAK